MVNAQHIYSAEEALRRIVRDSESINNPAVEYLGSTIVIDSIARFAGSHSVSHATKYALAVAARESLEIVAESMTDVKARTTKFAAEHSKHRIVFNPNAQELDQLLVLHEIAHEIAGRSHNQAFVDAYVELVDKYLGSGLAFILRYEILTASNKSRSS